jgi:hypothetical protein
MIHDFPLGVFILLSTGLAFTAWIIYYILKMANDEMKDVSIQNQEDHQSH